MRTQEEINRAIAFFSEKDPSEKRDAILNVLDNELGYEEIECEYFDEGDPWVEQSANSAREFLDGTIELENIEL